MIRYIMLLFIVILALVSFPTPVYAIADPDSPPQINAVYVYEDCLEDGDIGVLMDIYIDYAAYPSETATEAYLGIFIDTDGTTQLKTAAPYTYVNSGYERNLIWIYFDAAEVTTFSLDAANVALYRIWLTGNPTLSWAGDPPKTIATIDEWYTTGTTATLIALRVLYYADLFELLWTLDLIEATTLGNRLTTGGEEYFLNVIQDLRLIAPGCFSAGTVEPVYEDIDYETGYGAVSYNGTGVVTGSPVTLAEGTTTLTITTTGTIFFDLDQGTSGNVSSGTGTVSGSPADLVAGTSNITVTAGGTIIVDVNLIDTSTILEDAILGTGLDLTTVAASFGMSRLMFSGIVWLVISVIICSATYKVTQGQQSMLGGGLGGGGGKVVLLVFDICIIGGALLGLLHVLVAVMMFIMFGVFTGYVIFFKGANA